MDAPRASPVAAAAPAWQGGRCKVWSCLRLALSFFFCSFCCSSSFAAEMQELVSRSADASTRTGGEHVVRLTEVDMCRRHQEATRLSLVLEESLSTAKEARSTTADGIQGSSLAPVYKGELKATAVDTELMVDDVHSDGELDTYLTLLDALLKTAEARGVTHVMSSSSIHDATAFRAHLQMGFLPYSYSFFSPLITLPGQPAFAWRKFLSTESSTPLEPVEVGVSITPFCCASQSHQDELLTALPSLTRKSFLSSLHQTPKLSFIAGATVNPVPADSEIVGALVSKPGTKRVTDVYAFGKGPYSLDITIHAVALETLKLNMAAAEESGGGGFPASEERLASSVCRALAAGFKASPVKNGALHLTLDLRAQETSKAPAALNYTIVRETIPTDEWETSASNRQSAATAQAAPLAGSLEALEEEEGAKRLKKLSIAVPFMLSVFALAATVYVMSRRLEGKTRVSGGAARQRFSTAVRENAGVLEVQEQHSGLVAEVDARHWGVQSAQLQ
ncbi:hypothetical protein Efla_006117 [Eimeria flavescens]